MDADIPSPVKGAIELVSLEAQEWFSKIKEKQIGDVDKKINIQTEVLGWY